MYRCVRNVSIYIHTNTCIETSTHASVHHTNDKYIHTYTHVHQVFIDLGMIDYHKVSHRFPSTLHDGVSPWVEIARELGIEVPQRELFTELSLPGASACVCLCMHVYGMYVCIFMCVSVCATTELLMAMRLFSIDVHVHVFVYVCVCVRVRECDCLLLMWALEERLESGAMGHVCMYTCIPV